MGGGGLLPAVLGRFQGEGFKPKQLPRPNKNPPGAQDEFFVVGFPFFLLLFWGDGGNGGRGPSPQLCWDDTGESVKKKSKKK